MHSATREVTSLCAWSYYYWKDSKETQDVSDGHGNSEHLYTKSGVENTIIIYPMTSLVLIT